MCNNIHRNKESRVRKIKESGVGWKIFIEEDGLLIPLYHSGLHYRMGLDGWITWGTIYRKDGGFCFLLTKKEAKRVLDLWRSEITPSVYSFVIKKIDYENGLVSQWEDKMVEGSVRIALCKRFKVRGGMRQ